MNDGRTNGNQGRGASRDPAADALAALQGMHVAPSDNGEAVGPTADEAVAPQPMPAPAPSPGDSAAGNLSASGFVGMLAKNSSEDSGEGDTPESTNGTRPQPKPMVGGRPASRRTTAGTDEIHEAREIGLAESAPAAPRASRSAPQAGPRRPGRRTQSVPAWYPMAMPLTFTIGGLLTLVSMWAVLASICILCKIHGMPLVTVPEEGGKWEFWDYIPFLMLLCLPVAIALVFMGAIMAKQIKAAERAEG